jgi:hypothetical protein
MDRAGGAMSLLILVCNTYKYVGESMPARKHAFDSWRNKFA